MSCRCAAAETGASAARTLCARDATGPSSPCQWNTSAPACGTARRPRGKYRWPRPRACRGAITEPSCGGFLLAGPVVQAAFLTVLVLPPPASSADVLARLDGARARLASDGWKAACVQRIDGNVVG